jgi:uncharacterized iron-regulated membrane protein
MTFTVTFTGRGIAIGLMVAVAVISGGFAYWNHRRAQSASHGTTALAHGMSSWAAGLMCVVSAGVASLLSQYG